MKRGVTFFLFFILFGQISLAHASSTIQVSLTADGTPITSGMYAYCYDSNYSYYYNWGEGDTSDGIWDVSVEGTGTFTCSAYCSEWDNCIYSGYPTDTVTVSSDGETVPASLDFEARDKTISVSVTAGGSPVTSDMAVYCSQQESPWTYDYVDDDIEDDGIYDCQVGEGNYYVYAYCTTYPCSYTGYPSDYVTVNSTDTTVNASLEYTIADKTIHMTIMGGDEQITSGVTGWCSEQGGSWAYSYSSTFSGEGTIDLNVGEGHYSCSAYCTDYSDCDVSGYPSVDVVVEEADTDIDVTLSFLSNNATLSGIVTGGGAGMANAWVSVNSYSVGSADGDSAATGATLVKGAIVTDTSYDTTQVYSYAMTDSSGAFDLRLPAGTYTVTAYPPWDQQNFSSSSTEVTVTEDQTTSVSLSLTEKTAQIVVTAEDTSGNPVADVYVSGWSWNGSTGSGDWFWGQTGEDGTYTAYGVEGYTYDVMTYFWDDNSNYCSYTNEGIQSVLASSTPASLTYTFPTCNCTMTVNAVDSSDNIVSQIYGSIDARPTSSDYWYGSWGYMSGGTGTVKVEEGTELFYELWFWDNDYIAGDSQTATCSDGSGSVDIAALSAIQNAVSGIYNDSSGAVALDNSYIYVYAFNGRTYRSCEADASGYSCALSEGDWTIGYWIDPASGYASSSPGSTSSSVTVTSAGGLTYDIQLLRTGTIDVSVLDPDGNPMTYTWVEATPYSIADEGGNEYQYLYNSNGCLTGVDGTCSIAVGASAEGVVYYLNAYIAYSMRAEGFNLPEETAVTVVEGESVSATLSFTAPDGTSVITVTEGDTSGGALTRAVLNAEGDESPVALTTVDCFSSHGGAFSVETDENGIATCPCSTEHDWYAAAYNVVGNSLYMSAVTPITCGSDDEESSGDDSGGDSETTDPSSAVIKAAAGEGALEIDLVATLPDGDSVTITDADSQSLTLTLSDGFSVFFPAGSLGGDGETDTCSATPVVTPITSNRQPASFYGYNVSCFDGNGVAITQLNSDATFTLPINTAQAENMGLDDTELQGCYFDDGTGAYTTNDTAVIDGDNDTISFQIDHLTDFVIVGNGLLGALNGEDGGEIGIGDDGTDDGTGNSASGASGCGCTMNGNPQGMDIAGVLIAFLYLTGYLLWRRKFAPSCLKK